MEYFYAIVILAVIYGMYRFVVKAHAEKKQLEELDCEIPKRPNLSTAFINPAPDANPPVKNKPILRGGTKYAVHLDERNKSLGDDPTPAQDIALGMALSGAFDTPAPIVYRDYPDQQDSVAPAYSDDEEKRRAAQPDPTPSSSPEPVQESHSHAKPSHDSHSHSHSNDSSGSSSTDHSSHHNHSSYDSGSHHSSSYDSSSHSHSSYDHSSSSSFDHGSSSNGSTDW